MYQKRKMRAEKKATLENIEKATNKNVKSWVKEIYENTR